MGMSETDIVEHLYERVAWVEEYSHTVRTGYICGEVEIRTELIEDMSKGGGVVHSYRIENHMANILFDGYEFLSPEGYVNMAELVLWHPGIERELEAWAGPTPASTPTWLTRKRWGHT
jgi:hypothetical protein